MFKMIIFLKKEYPIVICKTCY